MKGMMPSIISTKANAANKSPQFIFISQKNGRYYNRPSNEFTSQLTAFYCFIESLKNLKKSESGLNTNTSWLFPKLLS